MWILSILPDAVFHLITLAGVLGIIASFVCGFIPFVTQYKLPIQVASALALAFGIYFEGGIANEAKWQARVKELEAKVAVAEEKSKTANAEIAGHYKQQQSAAKQQQILLQERIVKVREQIDAECKVPPEAIRLLNEAAEAVK